MSSQRHIQYVSITIQQIRPCLSSFKELLQTRVNFSLSWTKRQQSIDIYWPFSNDVNFQKHFPPRSYLLFDLLVYYTPHHPTNGYGPRPHYAHAFQNRRRDEHFTAASSFATAEVWPSAHSELRERRQRRCIMVVALEVFAMMLFGFCLLMLVGLVPTLTLGWRGEKTIDDHCKQHRVKGATIATCTFPSSSSAGAGAEGAEEAEEAEGGLYCRGRWSKKNESGSEKEKDREIRRTVAVMEAEGMMGGRTSIRVVV